MTRRCCYIVATGVDFVVEEISIILGCGYRRDSFSSFLLAVVDRVSNILAAWGNEGGEGVVLLVRESNFRALVTPLTVKLF